MFNIGGLFGKFLSLQSKEIGVRTFIAESLKRNLGIVVEITDIEIKNGVVLIKKLSQAGKNALFMKKDIVIEEVNKAQGDRKILNIKF